MGSKCCKRHVEDGTYIALFPYKAETENELSFKKGERMEVLKQVSTSWARARSLKTKKEGVVPLPYLARYGTFEEEKYFHPGIPRDKVYEKLLNKKLPVGSYILRKSSCSPTLLVLSIKDNGDVIKNYKVVCRNEGYNIPHSTAYFPTIPELIKFYKKDANGLSTKLTKPCTNRDPPHVRKLCRASQTSMRSQNF